MNIRKLLSKLAIMSFALCLSCDKDSTVTQSQTETPTAGKQIVLDANSRTNDLQKIVGLSGDTLVIDSGTTILRLDANHTYAPIASTSRLSLALNPGDGASSLVPAGMKNAASFGISANVDGDSAVLLFVPPENASATSEMPNTGVRWVAPISDTGIHSGATLSLYKIAPSHEIILIESKVIDVPVNAFLRPLKTSKSTDVSPNGTGSYIVNYHYSPLLKSAPSSMPTSGVYWTEYSSIPETTYVVGGQTFGGPLFVGSVSIGEPSTGELMADVAFPDGVNCVTYTNNNDKVQYWVERTQNTEGKTTALKVASTAANIPYLNLNLHSAESGQTILFVHGLMPDSGVVHSPDGSVLANPYEDPSLKIGGAKELYFNVDNYSEGRKTTELFNGSGYDLYSLMYNQGVYSFTVSNTSDGRALIEENILSKANWFPIKSMTNGNVGYYELQDSSIPNIPSHPEEDDSLILNVTSHPKEDTVSTQKIILEGTIDNPAKLSPVTDILVAYSSGTQSQQVHATITGDSTFSAELNLFPGVNIIALVPTGKNASGADVTFRKYRLKAKNIATEDLLLTYEAAWTGKIEVTKKITSFTREPDTAVTVSVTNISADLKMVFKYSKLWYIRKSHENAITCSELSNCHLFSGSKIGAVSVSESTETQAKNCDDELPLTTTRKGSASASLDKYNFNVSVTLTPWDSNDVSTDRNYHLAVNAGPEFSIHTDSNWPTGVSQSYDCLTKSWKSNTGKIGPTIRLDDAELKFINTEELEAYTDSPTTAKSWSFTSTKTSEDGLTVEEYTATLSIQP